MNYRNFKGQVMTDISKITYEDYLEYQNSLMHYGVKGMRWGVRKEDDYVSSKKPSAARKASIAAESGLNIAKAAHLTDVLPTSPMGAVVNELSRKMIDPAYEFDPAGFALRLGVASAVKAADGGAVGGAVQASKNALRGGWKKKPELAEPGMSLKDIQEKVVKPINPDYPGLGTTNNCMRCTYAYEMRRRGYDVKPSRTIFATGQNAIGKKVILGNQSKNVKIKNEQYALAKPIVKALNGRPTSTDIMNALAKEPNGSRGELQMSWGPLAGGHSVAYEIINNKPVVIDAQSGKSYNDPKALNELTKMGVSFKYTRLDNVNLNKVAMPAWMRDAKE